MKKILLLESSFVSPSYELMINALAYLHDEQFMILKFKGLERTVRAAKLSERYENFIAQAKSFNLDLRPTEAYGLDEFFGLYRKDEDIYITPTNSINTVISSAAMLKYPGRIMLMTSYNKSIDQPIFTNVQPMCDMYLTSKSFGRKGLDISSLNNPLNYRGVCHYTLNGITYNQQIRESDFLSQGSEGETLRCEEFDDLRIKIYERYLYKFEIEKVEKMMELAPILPDIAIPLAIVYDEEETPIGIVMRNFDGEDIRLDELHTHDNAEAVVLDLIEQVMALQTYGIFHKDLAHNILFDFKHGKAHIIDVDSTQYLEYPAVVQTTDKTNGIPLEYYNDLNFYYSLDLSYTLLTIVIGIYMDPDDLLGQYDDEGHVKLRSEPMNFLKYNVPYIYEIIKYAYVSRIPVSPAHQLDAVLHTDFEPDTVIQEEVPEEPKPIKWFDFGDEEDKLDEVSNEEVTEVEEKETEPEIEELSWFQRLLLKMFLQTGNTTIDDESELEQWQRFIRQKQWVRPAVYTAVGFVFLIMLLVAFFKMK